MKINEYAIHINTTESFADFERKSTCSVKKKKKCTTV